MNFVIEEKYYYKKVGNNSNIINDEIVAIVGKFLKYKCKSKKQQRQFSNKCNLLRLFEYEY